MKTIVKRIKTVLQDDSTLKSYVKRVEIVAPRILPEIPESLVPYIGIAPVRVGETYVAQRKEATNLVDIYAVTYLQVTENAIIGDSVKKGMLELVEDIETAIRGHRLSESGTNYLSKPINILSTEFSVAGYGDVAYLFVASITIQCIRLFNLTLP